MQQKIDSTSHAPTHLKTALSEHVKTKKDVPRLEDLDDIEGWLMEHAIAACGDSLTEAAELLGISRATSYRRVGKARGVIH